MKYYTAKTDVIFKRAICVPPYDYLKKIIEIGIEQCVKEILNVNVSDEDLTNPIYIKNKILDVTAITDKGKVNIEINSNVNKNIRLRNFNYLANMCLTETKKGMDYNGNQMFYQINLSWNAEKKLPIKGVYEMVDLATGFKYVPNFKIIEFNMDKIDNLWYHGTDEEKKSYKELIALNLKSEELSLISKGDAMMESFKENVDKLNYDDDVVNFLNTREDWERLDKAVREEEMKTAINKAVDKTTKKVTKEVTKEVTEKTKLETAKNLLKLNVSVEDISKATGLSLRVLENIKD